MSTTPQWKPGYEIGVPEMDAQHRYFFGLIAALSRHDGKDYADRDVRRTLDEIERYSYFHFQSEELLMALYHYNGLKRQGEEHAQLLEDFGRAVHRFKKGEQDLGDLVTWLTGWFLRHTQESDTAFGDFVREFRQL